MVQSSDNQPTQSPFTDAESPIQVRHMGMKSLIYCKIRVVINAWPRMPNQPCVQGGEKCLADRHPSPQNQTYLLIDSSCPTRGVEVPRGTRGFASVFPDPKGFPSSGRGECNDSEVHQRRQDSWEAVGRNSPNSTRSLCLFNMVFLQTIKYEK